MSKSQQPGGARSREEDLTNERERVTSDVRMRFAKYGDEACAIILGFALQPTRMPMLMERVNLNPRGRDLSAYLDAIGDYIAQEGALRFSMLAMQKHYKKAETASVLLSKIEAKLSEQLAGQLGDVVIESDIIPEPAEPPRAPAAAPPPPAAAPVEAVQVEAAPVEAAPPAPRPDAPHITVPGYSGPDRRSGTERRHKPDRRAGLAAINKNKRYGGDRRKRSKGRRKEDGIRPDFWWKLLGTPNEHRIHGAPKSK